MFTFAFRRLLFFRSSDRPQALRAVHSSLRTLALSGNAFIADRVLAAVVRALTSTAPVADSDSDGASNAADTIEAVGGFPCLEVLRLSHMHAPPSMAACATGMSGFKKQSIYLFYMHFFQFMFLSSHILSLYFLICLCCCMLPK